MIKVENIRLSIAEKAILNNVNLEVTPGRFNAIAGPNGAGKSSLLKILASETRNYQGEVRINGKKLADYSARDLSNVRSVLPQSSHVQFPFEAKQVVEMGTRSAKLSVNEQRQTLEEVIELTGVEDLLHRNHITLSGGEQQRVQLARVLVQVWKQQSFSRFVLLDEPTSSLDIARQQLIFGIVKKACERNIGVLAIVHDLNHVAQFADRLYLMKEGRVVANGNPKEVFTKSIIENTFCCRVNVYHDPCNDCPYIVPEKEIIESKLTLATHEY